MGKSLLIKIAMGKYPNEMGNCPFAPPPGCATGTRVDCCEFMDISGSSPLN